MDLPPYYLFGLTSPVLAVDSVPRGRDKCFGVHDGPWEPVVLSGVCRGLRPEDGTRKGGRLESTSSREADLVEGGRMGGRCEPKLGERRRFGRT